jgi:hypothetical protein
MSFMFEVLYKPPADAAKESALAREISALGGRLDYREEPQEVGRGGICLTFEFDDLDSAAQAAAKLRERGVTIEGPADYGP